MNGCGPAAALLLACAAGTALAQAPVESGVEPAPKLSPLLGLLLGRVVDAGIEHATGDTTLGLFRRLANKMRNEPQDKASLVIESELTPALGYAMELLDPASFAVLRPVPVAGSGARLRTGDVFVLQFSTNLPGLVRLENTDPAGKVADLGTYTVLVDQLNRIPRDKGIQLQGTPGTERLRFYFYPCMPVEGLSKRWAADFHGKLPACRGSAPMQTASAGAYGTVTPRALVNLSQPDATMVFAGARDYQPGELTQMDALIRHERPQDGR
jgi:hypothetical protein